MKLTSHYFAKHGGWKWDQHPKFWLNFLVRVFDSVFSLHLVIYIPYIISCLPFSKFPRYLFRNIFMYFKFWVLCYIYIYIRLKIKPNSVRIRFLELSNFCSSLDGIWTHTIVTLQHHSLSLIYIYIYIHVWKLNQIYIYRISLHSMWQITTKHFKVLIDKHYDRAIQTFNYTPIIILPMSLVVN